MSLLFAIFWVSVFLITFGLSPLLPSNISLVWWIIVIGVCVVSYFIIDMLFEEDETSP
jgi:uncharacterized membrane protein